LILSKASHKVTILSSSLNLSKESDFNDISYFSSIFKKLNKMTTEKKLLSTLKTID